MRITSYLRAHRYSLVTTLALWVIVDVLILASDALAQAFPDFGYLNLLMALLFVAGNLFGWVRERGQFSPLRDAIDKGLALDGIMPDGNTYHQRLVREAIQQERKTWRLKVSEERTLSRELQDCIVQWTHEIKVPLSVMELVVEQTMEEDRHEADAAGTNAGLGMVAISNMLFRLRGNYRSLAMMAVMTATTITAFGTSLSLKYFVSETLHLQCPWSYSAVFAEEETEVRIRETIAGSAHTLLDEGRGGDVSRFRWHPTRSSDRTSPRTPVWQRGHVPKGFCGGGGFRLGILFTNRV